MFVKQGVNFPKPLGKSLATTLQQTDLLTPTQLGKLARGMMRYTTYLGSQNLVISLRGCSLFAVCIRVADTMLANV